MKTGEYTQATQDLLKVTKEYTEITLKSFQASNRPYLGIIDIETKDVVIQRDQDILSEPCTREEDTNLCKNIEFLPLDIKIYNKGSIPAHNIRYWNHTTPNVTWDCPSSGIPIHIAKNIHVLMPLEKEYISFEVRKKDMFYRHDYDELSGCSRMVPEEFDPLVQLPGLADAHYSDKRLVIELTYEGLEKQRYSTCVTLYLRNDKFLISNIQMADLNSGKCQ